MSSLKKATLAFALLLATLCAADVMVQLNVNRPLNDVNEKFISFSVDPEDLYKALDGPHRKAVTRMAALLGESYVKFVGDYYIGTNSEIKLRNPTKIIWKGFNRWTRAVNWTMIIPVPYTPGSWDAMHALKILNNSYMIGITDVIWQLGTDFGSSRAQDYVNELNTLNLIVDSFRSSVNNWQIVGADISAGSSPEETRRYIEMSKDVNAAFGWTQSSDYVPSNSVSSYINENDAALRVLLNKKVPVWFSLPKKPKNNKTKQSKSKSDQTSDAMRWAQIMGEAASNGFDVIFKKLSLVELEKPDYSFYVTAVFKKVMGSRVFPARPLHMMKDSIKLYTHCANAVSGGIAFMIVNPEESPMQLSVRSVNTYTGTEVWQYTLNFKDSGLYLNNNKLTLNSTLKPEVKVKSPEKSIQLSTPGMSVSFWVLPSANLEHCQYTEIDAVDTDVNSNERVLNKRYSSSDRLLRKLIQETSLSNSLLPKIINRKRRYATEAKRPKRFILENNSQEFNGFGKLFEPLSMEEKTVKKRENVAVPERRFAALEWLQNLVKTPLTDGLPLLKRGTRSIDKFKPIFAKKNGKKLPFTKKIIDIKRPERKTKPLFDQDEFNEEEFFKKIGEQNEPEYMRLPEGDVHLKHIANSEGDEEFEEEEKKKQKPTKLSKIVSQSKETASETRPMRLLPTEFYESLPLNPLKHNANKVSLGSALNSLLFPEPFSKKPTEFPKKFLSKNTKEKSKAAEVADVDEVNNEKYQESYKKAEDFLRAQEELSKAFLADTEDAKVTETTEKEEDVENDAVEEQQTEEPLILGKKLALKKRKYIDLLSENFDNYFRENDESENTRSKDTDDEKVNTEPLPWWDLGGLRKKRTARALRIHIPDDAWRTNMITKDDELPTPLRETLLPEQLLPEQLMPYEYQIEDGKKQFDNAEETITTKTLMATVKKKVSKFVDIVTRHVSEWYNTLTKQSEPFTSSEETTLKNNLK